MKSKGDALAVASRGYAPLGFASDEIFFGVPVRTACERVLKCPSDSDISAGNRR